MGWPTAWLRNGLAALLLAGLPQPAPAQPSETAVKAAFLPKFARYVAWPPVAQPAAGRPIVLCIIGSDPFGRLIDDALVGQRADQNPIVVRRIATADRAAGCHLAFVRGNRTQSTVQILAALRGQPILTITDSRDGAVRGMIHFELKNGRVSFHVDDAMAGQNQLAISSRLLGVALSVKQRPA